MGGVERLLLDMAPHYDRDRFDVRHCNVFDATGGEGPFPTGLRATGLPYSGIVGSRLFHLPRVARELRALTRDQSIEILHLHMAHATVLGGLVGRWLPGTRVIVSKHYTYEMLESVSLKVADRIMTNRADAVTAVSRHVETDLLRHGARPDQVRVIPNGIDLADFDRRSLQTSETVRRRPDELLIGCVGSLHARKGHQYVVRAMPEVLARFPAARLVLWGDGSERSNLEQLSQALGVRDCVDFVGFSGNVPAGLRQIDLFIQPSLQEAFGIVILEAMAVAKPVIGTRIGGIPEVIEEGLTGKIVPPRDPEAVAKAICELFEDKQRRTAMGCAGRTRVEREFQISKTVQSYERLYSELAS